MRKTFQFNTLSAAEAFIEGVEYVNDSTIEVEGWRRDEKGKFVVALEDLHATDNNDPDFVFCAYCQKVAGKWNVIDSLSFCPHCGEAQ